jgi:hypothetical protein
MINSKQTANKRANKQQTRWTPPRGIRLACIPNRGSPFGVYWTKDGKRQSKFLKSESDQIRFAKEIASDLEKYGSDSLTWNRQELSEWSRFKADYPDTSIRDLLDCWKRFGNLETRKTISELIPQFKREKIAKGVSADTQTAYKNHLGRFSRNFGSRLIDSVKPGPLFDWLQSLPFGPVTRSNHRKTVRTFYSWANLRGYATSNPAKLVEDEKVVKEIEILTVEEGRQFFAANRDTVAIGRLALEAFGLFRYSSAKRLLPSDINWSEKGITLPAAQIKTARRKYVDGHPDNLWQWLEFAPVECWKLPERQYQEEKRFAFMRAEIAHPKNCLRHSACTYHYAAFKNPGLTASLMAHTNLATMEQFYRGRATHTEGLDWFGIVP